MDDDAPGARYYRAMHGAWRGEYRFRIVDAAGFRTARIDRVDRWRVRALAAATRFAGSLTMATTVDAESRRDRCEVVHTTRLSQWGATVLRSVETIALDADGRRGQFAGTYRLAPWLWRTRPWIPAAVEIDDDAARARYRLTWMGLELLQIARVAPDGLRLTQTTAWSHAEATLVRQPPR